MKPVSLPPWLRRRRDRKTPPASSRRLRSRTSSPRSLTVDPIRLLIASGTGTLLCLLLCIHLWPSRVTLNLGEVARKEIVAQRTVRFIDTEATQRAKAEAERLPGKYTAVGDATASASQNLRDSFVADPVLSLLPDAERAEALRLGDRAVADAMSRVIRDEPDELPAARSQLRRSHSFATVRPELARQAVARAAEAAISYNFKLDVAETEKSKSEARQRIKPIYRRFAAGETVLRANEPVTQVHLDAFAALGLQNAQIDAMTVVMVCVLVFLLIAFVTAYLRFFHPNIYEDRSKLFLLAILTVVSVLGLKVGSTLLGLPISGGMIGYLAMMCVTSAGMVIALLVRPSIAVLIVSLLSAVSGLVLNNEIRFSLLTLGSAYAGIVACATLRNRTDLLRALGILCGANAILIGLIGQLQGDLPQELLSGMLWGVISGAFALFLYYVGTAAFEKLFGVTTNLRLLELSDPATPILQEMRIKVPGTYAHSLMVGTLAHAAAEAIGADALLARVAAYYHDLRQDESTGVLH